MSWRFTVITEYLYDNAPLDRIKAALDDAFGTDMTLSDRRYFHGYFKDISRELPREWFDRADVPCAFTVMTEWGDVWLKQAPEKIA